jgi:tRNA modification GTPase
MSHNRNRLLFVRTKADLAPPSDVGDELAISARTGCGLETLQQAVAAKLAEPHVRSPQLLGSTAARCRESLSNAILALQHARQEADDDAGEELVVFELREALDHLGRILGAVYSDDVLDRIFSRFCIGK